MMKYTTEMKVHNPVYSPLEDPFRLFFVPNFFEPSNTQGVHCDE